MLARLCEVLAPCERSRGARWRWASPHLWSGTGSGSGLPLVTALSWPAPAALALAARRSPVRDAAIYALQMWAYFAHYDMPDDDPDALLRAPEGRLPDPLRPRHRPRHDAHHPAPARARARGPRGPARVRPVNRALELVPRAARDAPLHARAPPRAVPALGGADGGLLRPRLRRLLGGADRAAVVRGRERVHAAGAADHGGGRAAVLETPLAPALPFAARQPLRSNALTPFRHVSHGSAHPVPGGPGHAAAGLGLRAHARLRRSSTWASTT